jgi:hypothetical protein
MDKPITTTSKHLGALCQKLDAVDGVTARFGPDALVVAFKGHQVAQWMPDGEYLAGAFNCEAALLRAHTAEEAYHLTVGRLA